MAEPNEYFNQLLRGEHPPNPYAFSSRIPHDEKAALFQVTILLRNAQDAADDAMAVIRDILRFHGGATIRSQIRPQERELLPKLEAFVGPEDLGPEDV